MTDRILPKPPWLKRRLSLGPAFSSVVGHLRETRLHTVCEEALCPNRAECFSAGTATFLIMGDVCTRNCGFCAVAHGRPGPLDPDEPARVAEAAHRMGLKYVVITSVTRDDLPDGGASHFARAITEVKKAIPGAKVEVLVPDFGGSRSSLEVVLEAGPDVLNHNVETVPRLYPIVRPRADYSRSLELLAKVKEISPQVATKSGLMLGLGEDEGEVEGVLEDLVAAGCRILTLGQYLRPSKAHLPVARYVSPEEFEEWRKKALEMGFQKVASGPLVRSSYQAHEMFNQSVERG
jgi:lipoic acid synthetase